MSSTYLNQMFGGLGADVNALLSKFSIYRFATTGETGEPMAAPWVCL